MYFPILCFHQTNHIKSRLQVMSRSRCIPLLVLNIQCSFIAPSLLGSFRITELIVVDSTSGSLAFIDASCLWSTRITTNTRSYPWFHQSTESQNCTPRETSTVTRVASEYDHDMHVPHICRKLLRCRLFLSFSSTKKTFRTERTTNSSSTETMESTGIAKTARLATRFQISFAFDLQISEQKWKQKQGRVT